MCHLLNFCLSTQDPPVIFFYQILVNLASRLCWPYKMSWKEFPFFYSPDEIVYNWRYFFLQFSEEFIGKNQLANNFPFTMILHYKVSSFNRNRIILIFFFFCELWLSILLGVKEICPFHSAVKFYSIKLLIVSSEHFLISVASVLISYTFSVIDICNSFSSWSSFWGFVNLMNFHIFWL